MNRHIQYALAFTLALVGILGSPLATLADEITTTPVVQQSAPAAITRCILTTPAGSLFIASFNLFDRSSHSLIDATIDYRFFDRDNTQIGRETVVYTPAQTLAPQDTGTYNNNYINAKLAEPPSAVSRITCRLSAAHFTGRNAWHSGSPWQGGPLSAMPKIDSRGGDDNQSSDSGASNPPAIAAYTSRGQTFKFDIEKAWNDQVQNGVYVHDTLTIHGGDGPIMVRPGDFVLTMTLANGTQKTYGALTQPAPRYQKFSPLSKLPVIAFEIDPKDDLGALGSLAVPPHANVDITVTFAVPDSVADASANRRVTLK